MDPLLDWCDLGTLGNVGLALFFGGLVGLERETAHKPAGFRTHMLVSGAACALLRLGTPLIAHYQAAGSSAISADPLRLFEAAITGIAFIGVGTIFRSAEDGMVQGLTTACSILMAGVIGMAISVERYVLGAGLSLLTVGSLWGLSRLERRLRRLRPPE